MTLWAADAARCSCYPSSSSLSYCSSSLSLLPITVFLRSSPPAAPVTQTPEKRLETWRPSTKWRIWAWLWTRSGTQIMFWPPKWLWKIRWVPVADPNLMHTAFKWLNNALLSCFCVAGQRSEAGIGHFICAQHWVCEHFNWTKD